LCGSLAITKRNCWCSPPSWASIPHTSQRSARVRRPVDSCQTFRPSSRRWLSSVARVSRSSFTSADVVMHAQRGDAGGLNNYGLQHWPCRLDELGPHLLEQVSPLGDRQGCHKVLLGRDQKRCSSRLRHWLRARLPLATRLISGSSRADSFSTRAITSPSEVRRQLCCSSNLVSS
jgi:hypothetical protein